MSALPVFSFPRSPVPRRLCRAAYGSDTGESPRLVRRALGRGRDGRRALAEPRTLILPASDGRRVLAPAPGLGPERPRAPAPGSPGRPRPPFPSFVLLVPSFPRSPVPRRLCRAAYGSDTGESPRFMRRALGRGRDGRWALAEPRTLILPAGDGRRVLAPAPGLGPERPRAPAPGSPGRPRPPFPFFVPLSRNALLQISTDLV